MSEQIRASLRSLRELGRLIRAEAGLFVRMRVALVLLLVTGTAVLSALGPLALKWVVDGFTGHATGPNASPALLITLYVTSQWLARIAGEVRGLLFARAERRMLRTLTERLFDHVMHLPLRFHLEKQTGAINQTLANGLQGLQAIFQHLVFTFLPIALELGTIAVVLTRLNHPIFLTIFSCALVCYVMAFIVAAARVSQPAQAASAAYIASGAAITDGILNYETVKYFAAERLVRQRVSDALVRTEGEWIRFFRRYAANGAIVATIYAAFLLLTVGYAGRQVLNGSMTVGDFVLVNTYMLQIVRPVELLGYAMQEFSQGLAFAERMLAIFREQVETFDRRGQQRSEVVAACSELTFAHVSVSYGAGRQILRDITFEISRGRALGIVGASGSGKSTIVRLLVRLLEPDSGSILLDGIPISQIPTDELRGAIAVVPQDTILLNDTIGYNIAFGKRDGTAEEIEQAARLAGLHDFVASLPEKYDTRVGERGIKLSGGERQRVAIARAAIRRPRIYVFDEATSSLDSRTEREIVANLREVSRSSTTLIIAHRLSTVIHADEIVVLEDGLIVERGTHRSLLERNGRYAALWLAQQHPADVSASPSLHGAR